MTHSMVLDPQREKEIIRIQRHVGNYHIDVMGRGARERATDGKLCLKDFKMSCIILIQLYAE